MSDQDSNADGSNSVKNLILKFSSGLKIEQKEDSSKKGHSTHKVDKRSSLGDAFLEAVQRET